MRNIFKKSYSKKGLEKKMEKVWKNLQKVIRKGGKHEEKTFQKTMWKKRSEKRGWGHETPESPGGPWAQQTQQKSTRYIQTFHTNPTMSEEGDCEEGEWRKVSEERWLQKTNFNHLPRLGRLQARSGYIWTTSSPGFVGRPAGYLALGTRICGPGTGDMTLGPKL